MRKIKSIKQDKDEIATLEPTREMYPTFYIGLEHLPEAKKWEIGKTYYVTLELKETGMSMHKNGEGKEHGDVNFDITGIEVEKNKKSDSDYKELPDKDEE